MSWSSGFELFEDIYKVIRPLIPKDKRVRIMFKLVKLFYTKDCDSFYEDSFDEYPEYKEVYRKYCKL